LKFLIFISKPSKKIRGLASRTILSEKETKTLSTRAWVIIFDLLGFTSKSK